MERIIDGAVWPGWETVRLIGRGSFGTVYEIERDVFGDKEKAALKVISIPQSSSDIDELYSEGYDRESITNTFHSYLKSIVAEYSLMRKMNGSANVVNCDDVRYVQHDDGIGWDILIKMELLTPLTKALGKTVSDEQVVRIGSDICKALILCKKHSIIHRDIKPANIFLSENGDYKLGDFGIAKTVEKTSGGTKIGTYEYMAPEVYNNRPYGVGADIYSLGMVLYWLLNERRTPFLPLPPELPSMSDKETARTRRFNGAEIPAPAHGSGALKRIVLKACAYEPEERYQSAEEMLRELEALSDDARSVKLQEDQTAAPQPVSAPTKDLDETVRMLRAFAESQPVSAPAKDPDETVRVIHAPVVSQPVSAPAKAPSAEDPDETVRVIHASEPRQGRDFQAQMPPVPAAEKSRSKSKKGLIFGVLGGLMLLAAVLLIVLLPKGGSVDTDEPGPDNWLPTEEVPAPVEETPAPVIPDFIPVESESTESQPTAEATAEVTPEPAVDPDSPEGRAAAMGLPAPPDIDIDSWEFILANEYNSIGEYAPQGPEMLEGQPLDSRIIEPMKAMVADARGQGLSVFLSSGYRSYADQRAIYNRKVEQYPPDGKDSNGRWIVPPPGTSEHQTGLACDITDVYHEFKDRSLEETAMYQYMSQHCQEFGFIVRYPADKEDVTGVMYEPWHFRYVGVEAATYITENGICLEEFVSLYRDIYSADNPAPEE